jgi:hypothetical protein
MNEQVEDAIGALARGWTVEIDRSRPGAATAHVDAPALDTWVPVDASQYELRVYRITKTARDSATPPHSISSIDASAARELLARGAVYVGPTRATQRLAIPTDPTLPPVRG